MDIKYLKNFITIVEEGNLTAASKKLYVAQPALSSQLKVLEKELGTELMKRGSRKMALTDAGKLLYDKAKHITYLENSLQKEVFDCINGLTGTLRIGMILSTAITLLDGLLFEFYMQNPDIKYEIYESDSHEIINLLQSDIIEVGIVRTPCPLSQDLDIMFIGSEKMIAAYNDDYHSFNSDKETIPIQDLKGIPICIVRRYEQMFTDACVGTGFSPNFFCINNQITANLMWAKYGMGVAIVPLSSFDCVKDNHLKYKIIDEPAFNIKRAIVTMKERPLSKQAANFIKLCSENMCIKHSGYDA